MTEKADQPDSDVDEGPAPDADPENLNPRDVRDPMSTRATRTPTRRT